MQLPALEEYLPLLAFDSGNLDCQMARSGRHERKMQRRGSPAVDRVRLYLSIRSPKPVEQWECRPFSLPARNGIQPFPSRGVGRKKPESMGHGSLSSRKIWHVPKKNSLHLRDRRCGAAPEENRLVGLKAILARRRSTVETARDPNGMRASSAFREELGSAPGTQRRTSRRSLFTHRADRAGLWLFAVGGVEAPIEPVVDFGEHHARIAISTAQLEG